MAEILHVTAQAISKWENNKSYPDLEMLLALSNYFQVSVDELLGQKPPTILEKIFGKKGRQKMEKTTNTTQTQEQAKQITIFDINVDFTQDGLMYSQFLATKMQNLSNKSGKNYQVTAHSAATLKAEGPKADLILLMPTYGYAKEKIEEDFPETPVLAISKKDYGLLNAEGLLAEIEPLLS
ncbi:helix-turn-helix domain-containing protein [Enterococcus sp. HY326]|uniref:helix-turn-helix domain-containing protein n=1 Tax=Enterococcus sp. HY326 TaxID=2971265 RepID=UPI002240583E|nr:helix-turn-helix domain-containing protein [Enterococcus sp. HY326]